jgi:hypothetical protein
LCDLNVTFFHAICLFYSEFYAMPILMTWGVTKIHPALKTITPIHFSVLRESKDRRTLFDESGS